MDARFLGFSVSVNSSKLSLDSFMNELSQCLCHEIPSSATNNIRNIYIDTEHDEQFYLGMVVTIRDQKKFCKAQVNSADFVFDVVNLALAEKILEFNYFIIDRKSGLGLYQHYHQSCAPRLLGNILKNLFREYKRSSVEAALATETLSKGRELKDSEAIKIKKDYKSELLFNILVRQERLEQILKEYAKIKSFEFEYATLTPDVQAATPLASHVLKKRERLRFHTPTNVNSLASDIAAFVKRSNVSSGKIKVEDEFGDEFPLKIFDMPDYFAIYDYDVLAEHMNHIKSSEFYTSHLVTLLSETYNSEEYDHIFGVEVRDEA